MAERRRYRITRGNLIFPRLTNFSVSRALGNIFGQAPELADLVDLSLASLSHLTRTSGQPPTVAPDKWSAAISYVLGVCPLWLMGSHRGFLHWASPATWKLEVNRQQPGLRVFDLSRSQALGVRVVVLLRQLAPAGNLPGVGAVVSCRACGHVVPVGGETVAETIRP